MSATIAHHTEGLTVVSSGDDWGLVSPMDREDALALVPDFRDRAILSAHAAARWTHAVTLEDGRIVATSEGEFGIVRLVSADEARAAIGGAA